MPITRRTLRSSVKILVFCMDRIAAILVLLLLAVATTTACDPDQLYRDVVQPDRLLQFHYRDSRADGVREAMEYYQELCATGSTVPLLQANLSGCDYWNEALCARALAGDDLAARIWVSDALLRFQHELVRGSSGCYDLFQRARHDERTGLVSCQCLSHKACPAAMANGASTPTIGAVDEPTTLFQATQWILWATATLAFLSAVALTACTIQTGEGVRALRRATLHDEELHVL